MSRARSPCNTGKHTSFAEAKMNVLRFIDPDSSGCRLSQLGYTAYPGYYFKSPQGAAMAVSRIVHELIRDGLVWYEVGGSYHVTTAGACAAKGSPK